MKINIKCYLILFIFLLKTTAFSNESEAQTFLRVNGSGVQLVNLENKWVEESTGEKKLSAAEFGEFIHASRNGVKDVFNRKYQNREIIEIIVIPETTIDLTKAEFRVRVVQFKIYYRIRNINNIGTPACVGYLVRNDGKVREQ